MRQSFLQRGRIPSWHRFEQGLRLPWRAARAAALLVAYGCLAGCGGGGGDVVAVIPLYGGTFDVSYTLASDECGLVEEGAGGFIDQHDITQDGSAVVISSSAGFVLNVPGTIDGDGGFVASESYVLEEPGFAPCNVESALSYQNPTGDPVVAAESLFVFRLSCADGYQCESRAIGTAQRSADALAN